jgi:DNA-binding Xre family transcriptional regulator
MAENEKFYVRGYGTLTNRFSEVAEEQGWDIASLAREAKVAYATVKRLWDKDASAVHLEVLLKVAATLGVQLDALFPIVIEAQYFQQPGDLESN